MAKKKETNWEEELRKSYQNWEYLSHFGGHDPGWPDGVNMNLVRNHIIYEKENAYRIEAGPLTRHLF